ncbi:hypothetical protein F5883DRAFT_475909 [Diaporthe sp. PMI_573]|nr:hypothetical protein F5883DRAFT_475909 [Diaporthaceae sp. PMI_573]
MKKTKCDGESPCKKCKDNGVVCIAGTRKKAKFKQLPREYAEILENTQFALTATVHKLYSMVRNGKRWDLGEPDVNDRGQPVIHNIVQKLGCIRPNSDIDLPVHSLFPEDEQGLSELARQVEKQQQYEKAGHGAGHNARTGGTSSSDLDYSGFEEYYKVIFGSGRQASITRTVSPTSLTYDYSDSYLAPSTDWPPNTLLTPLMGYDQQCTQPIGAFLGMDMINKSLLESQGFPST